MAFREVLVTQVREVLRAWLGGAGKRPAARRVLVPPDPGGRAFEDDLDPGDLVFDGNLTPMLVWHEHYPVGGGWRSGWVLSYDTDGNGNPKDYIVGLGLPDVDAAVAQAREYLRSVGYPAAGWPSS